MEEYNNTLPIPNWENYYEITEDGNISSIDRDILYKNNRIHHVKGQVLKPSTDKDGYLYVMLSKEKHNTKTYIHKMTAQVYKNNGQPIPTGYHIHHKNGNRQDNRADNLEILPMAEHYRQHGKHCETA